MNQGTLLPPGVLHVVPLRNAAGGGIVYSLLALRAALDPQVRFAVLLPTESAAYPWVGRLRESGIETHVAGSAREVAAAVRRIRPPLTHIHFVEWQISGTIGAASVGSRVFWHLHSGLPLNARPAAAARIKYALASRIVERFLCVSTEIAAYIRAHGVPEKKTAVVPNGVDFKHFHCPSAEERAEARTALQLAPDERVILFFGRDAMVKGADRLASVLMRAHENGHVYSVLAVAPSAQSLEYLASIERVRDCGTVADVRALLWAAESLVLPSRTEALPFTVLEARATGLPVIATDLPGIQQLVHDPGTALVPFEAEAFAYALERFVQGGHVALPAALAHDLSLEQWTERVLGFYKSSSMRSA